MTSHYLCVGLAVHLSNFFSIFSVTTTLGFQMNYVPIGLLSFQALLWKCCLRLRTRSGIDNTTPDYYCRTSLSARRCMVRPPPLVCMVLSVSILIIPPSHRPHTYALIALQPYPYSTIYSCLLFWPIYPLTIMDLLALYLAVGALYVCTFYSRSACLHSWRYPPARPNLLSAGSYL